MRTILEELRDIEAGLIEEANEQIGSDRLQFHQLICDRQDRIVSIKSIKKICLKYRLRFLDIAYFKGEIPDEAERQLQALRKSYGLPLEKLRIIAPGELFKLENREKDPILLAEIYDNVYVVIHKWGAEFNQLRYLKSLPLRSIPSMILSVGFIAFLIALAFLPFTGMFDIPMKTFTFGFVVMWFGLMSYSAFIAISQNIFPTSVIWKSRFLD